MDDVVVGRSKQPRTEQRPPKREHIPAAISPLRSHTDKDPAYRAGDVHPRGKRKGLEFVLKFPFPFKGLTRLIVVEAVPWVSVTDQAGVHSDQSGEEDFAGVLVGVDGAEPLRRHDRCEVGTGCPSIASDVSEIFQPVGKESGVITLKGQGRLKHRVGGAVRDEAMSADECLGLEMLVRGRVVGDGDVIDQGFKSLGRGHWSPSLSALLPHMRLASLQQSSSASRQSQALQSAPRTSAAPRANIAASRANPGETRPA